MNAQAPTRWVRRLVAGIGVSALLASGLSGLALVAPPAAAAAPAAAPVPPPPLPSADALPTWQINGVVYSQAVVGDTVYVTGSFTKARPPGVAAGGAGEVAANNIFAFSLSTGNRVSSFNHSLNAQGLVIKASPDGSRVYVGGDFTSVDGASRGHVAAFATADNSLVSTWAPNVSSQVRGLGITASTVYVGGNFSSANGSPRTRLAAFQTSDGTLTPWAPTADGGYVWTMTMSPDNSRVIPGGSFTTLSGQAAYGMGALDASSGAPLAWPAQQRIRTAGPNGAITSLKADADQVYGSGYSYGDGASFEGTFALNPSTGGINWVNDCLGDTYDVAPAGQVLFDVSHKHDCSVVNGWPDTNPRVRWQKASASMTTATDTTTRTDAYGWNFVGLPYAAILHWFPSLAFGSYTPAGQAAWSVTTSGDYVVLGGEFPRVNGTAQQGLVRFRGRAAAPNKSGPTYATQPDTPVPATTATSLSAGSVRVSWGSAWDMDDPTLTYDVLRDNTTWVSSSKGSSNFWTLPRMGFVDTGLANGSTHKYQVRITDPYGNTLWSPVSNTVTVSSSALSGYAATVTNDGASHYWRLGEPSGSTATDWAGWEDSTLNGTYTRGLPGAIAGDSNTATGFDGSTAYAVDPTQVAGPNVFSEEAWFKTTSTTGGKIVSFGDQSTGNSGNYDRHIYMDPQGKVWFGVWNNGAYTVNTANSLNDGQWHHAVGTMDGSGVTLYVDGQKIGQNSGTTTAQPYNGYWRIGGDTAWNGNPYFNGAIDDVAIYPAALTASQVLQHYQVGKGTAAPNSPPTARFTHTEATLTTSVDGSTSSDPDGSVASYAWNFGDGGTATGATASHAYTTAGTYTVTLTVTDDKGATGTVSQAVTVTAPNTPPTAQFTHSETGLTTSVNGSGSTDPDGSIASYAWDFGDTGTATGVTANHTYAAAGTYTVKLTVTDNKGATGTTSAQVVVSAPANQAPTARFTHTESGLGTAVDGTSSTDDGTITSYAWDFGDNGTATGATASHTYAAAGTYTVKLTVTDNGGLKGTTSQPVTVTAATPAYASDSFGRTVTGGWGNADLGGAWTVSGTASRWSVGNGVGSVSLAAGSGGTASLGSVSKTDTEFAGVFSTDRAATGSGQYISVLARRVSSTADYRGNLQLAPNGSVTASITKVVSGTESTVTAGSTVAGVTVAPGDKLRIRMQAVGTSPTQLQLKVWKDGTTEPTAWTVTGSDSTAALQAAGSVGVYDYVSGSATNGPVVFGLDDVWVGPSKP